MPLEERYLELSEYVGEDDAEKTPESVLAMVQPVIMMTEEGNVDSGIGQLMQKLAGEIDMVTEAGEPTQMGQGLMVDGGLSRGACSEISTAVLCNILLTVWA